MTLGQRIKSARLERGLTQRELVGDFITRNMLSKIENDAATPSVGTLEYLAQALDLPAGYFLEGVPFAGASVPDGLDEARRAYRDGEWERCLAALAADPAAAATDEGYLLEALAGYEAGKAALDRGDAQRAREYAELAAYYNREGMYGSKALQADLALLLSAALSAMGRETVEERRALLKRALEELEKE